MPSNIDKTRYTLANNPTVFGKILRDEIPADVVYEDESVLAFRDIAPKAKVHVVIIPKQHMTCLRCMEESDADLMAKLMLAVNKVADILNVKDSGYRLITNAGPDSGQEVPHVHFHLLAGESLPHF